MVVRPVPRRVRYEISESGVRSTSLATTGSDFPLLTSSKPMQTAAVLRPSSAARDALTVIAATVGSGLALGYFDVSELLHERTRTWEHIQLDELPLVMLVLAISLVWFSWRRYRHARTLLTAGATLRRQLEETLREKRTLLDEQVRLQELERKRIARELHDELAQYLIAIKLDALALVQSPKPRMAEASAAIVQAVDRVQHVVRDLIGRLRPAVLDELGLAAAVESIVDQWRRRSPAVEFELELRGPVDTVDETVGLVAYRVIQEALTNAHKHSRASRIEVTVHMSSSLGDEKMLMIEVASFGAPQDPPLACTAGFGLAGIRERVEMLGGQLATEHLPNSFRLCTTIPCPC